MGQQLEGPAAATDRRAARRCGTHRKRPSCERSTAQHSAGTAHQPGGPRGPGQMRGACRRPGEHTDPSGPNNRRSHPTGFSMGSPPPLPLQAPGFPRRRPPPSPTPPHVTPPAPRPPPAASRPPPPHLQQLRDDRLRHLARLVLDVQQEARVPAGEGGGGQQGRVRRHGAEGWGGLVQSQGFQAG